MILVETSFGELNLRVEGVAMRHMAKLLIFVLFITFITPVYAEGSGGVNLKVGKTFYFEGNIKEDVNNSKEASMAEIKTVPFYKTTWFVTAVSVMAVAGATTGLYFLTKKGPGPSNTVKWQDNSN